MFQHLIETYKWWRHLKSPDHKAHAQRMARLDESLKLCLERHTNRADDLDDPAVMRADEMDLARAERILSQLEELTRECVSEGFDELELVYGKGPGLDPMTAYEQDEG